MPVVVVATMTAKPESVDAVRAACAQIAEAAARPGGHPEILGVHLEGPFLGERHGAHRSHLVQRVDRAWLDSLPAHVALITVGAECEGAELAWAWARDRGVVAPPGTGRFVTPAGA